MSDGSFYHIRRDLTQLLKISPSKGPSVRSFTKKKLLYTTLYEKEINGGLNPKAMELLQDFIEVLNQERILNVELFEITHPRHIIEIRSFSK